MTLGDIANKSRALTHTDTGSYTASNLLIDINVWYEKIVSMILESQDETDFDDQRNTNTGFNPQAATYPIVTTALVAGQRDYAMPVSEGVMKIKRVDITYDGTNYFRAMPFDDGEESFGFGNATNEDRNFITQAPQYDIKYNSIFVYPLATAANVTSGATLRVEWERNVTLFTSSDYTTDPNDSAVIPGFDAIFHPMLAWGAAFEFANAQNLPQAKGFGETLQDFEARLRTHYGRKLLDRELQFNYAYDSEFGR